MTNHIPKKVLFITPVVKQFRVPFFVRLHGSLLQQGVKLRVVYSEPGNREGTKKDSVDLPPHIGKKVRRYGFFCGRLIYQYVSMMDMLSSDLIIIVNSNRFIINFPLVFLSILKLKKIAFWGHAYNHQSKRDSFRERFKAALVNKVDWWFVYSYRERSYLLERKMPDASITVIENAIDTYGLRDEIQTLGQDKVDSFRERLKIPLGSVVAMYCGSLYEEKKIPFLLDAVERIRKDISSLQLLVIGAGPDAGLMRGYAAAHPWVKYEGAMFGIDKALAYRISDIVLNPGLVGLGILDCFAAGLPFITTDIDLHSPEVEYLKHGENGLMLPFDVESFSRQVSSLMRDKDALRHLGQGAKESGRRYTLENMIGNVREGVVSALSGNQLLREEK